MANQWEVFYKHLLKYVGNLPRSFNRFKINNRSAFISYHWKQFTNEDIISLRPTGVQVKGSLEIGNQLHDISYGLFRKISHRYPDVTQTVVLKRAVKP